MAALFSGAIVAACWAIGLFFLRFFRDTRDRLFAFFAAGFGVLSLDWLGLALLPADSPLRLALYAVRLAAFVLIAWAIVDKNRGGEGS